jgi:hypothetical protein
METTQIQPTQVLQILKNGLDKATRAGAFTLDEAASLHHGVTLLGQHMDQADKVKEQLEKYMRYNQSLKDLLEKNNIKLPEESK